MKTCPSCGSLSPEEARYCSRCGAPFRSKSGGEFEVKTRLSGWSWFWVTLLGSLALSFVLSVVFHLPIFVMGLFLPLIWQFRPKQQ